MSDVSRILSQIEAGDRLATRELLPLVYDELRIMAAQRLAQERPGQTLQATALVHEAFLRLVGTPQATSFANRRHFFAAAAEAMRRILIDRARRRGRARHGGGWQRIELLDLSADPPADQLLALDAALTRLTAEDPLAAEVVNLKYFAGLGREEIAQILHCSVHEVRQKWAYARAWLRLALDNE
ncbi:MAG: ECF-type sigma factor [Pirellulales bacterium]